jgi:filamentous hemagglutinin family protein
MNTFQCLVGTFFLAWSGLLQIPPAQSQPASYSIAQIIPDSSLAAESSRVDPASAVVNGQLSDRITGGAQRNSLLFHSFREFHVNPGQAVYFANPVGVSQIITRVTGNMRSQVFGTLGVLGTANLFLLNPNGIVFGPNARLDLRGSFTASTAQAMMFENGFIFSTDNPQAPPLLTLRIPIGLQWGTTAAPIINQSRAADVTGQVVGLQVDSGQSLSLLGGAVQLTGGILTASNGRIELGGIAPFGRIALTPAATGFMPIYSTGASFQDLHLSRQAIVNASGIGGGKVQVVGRNITLTERSQILADTLGHLDGQGITLTADSLRLEGGALIAAATFGSGRGGNLSLEARRSIDLVGEGFEREQQLYTINALQGTLTPFDRENGIFSGTSGAGASGNMWISTNRLTLQQGGVIMANVFNRGNGTHLVINAADIHLSEAAITVSTRRGGLGKSGQVTLNVDRLTMENGALLTSGTIGQGDGGPIEIHARERVLLQKTPSRSLFATAIASTSLGGATGASGNIWITTQQLIVRDGAGIGSNTGSAPRANQPFVGGPAGNLTIHASDFVEISGSSQDGFFLSRLLSETLNHSPAGIITINTPRLVLQNGGKISSATLNRGAGGQVLIHASEVEVSGTANNGVDKSGVFVSSGNSRFPRASGSGGNLQLTTDRLTVRDGATLAVNSLGTGDAGNLNISANQIQLDNQASLIASTASGEGGNMILNVREVVQLRRNSLISASAGGTGNGGNITINAGFIVANPVENSDIIANAIGGRGGKITLTAQGIFGLAFHPTLTPLSDITASSGIGLDGIVTLNVPNNDPSRGTTTLPSSVVDSAQLIATSCIARRTQPSPGSFIISGRGGLPTQPEDPAHTPFATYALVATPASTHAEPVQPQAQLRSPLEPNALPSSPAPLEIDGIYPLPDGRIILGRRCP